MLLHILRIHSGLEPTKTAFAPNLHRSIYAQVFSAHHKLHAKSAGRREMPRQGPANAQLLPQKIGADVS